MISRFISVLNHLTPLNNFYLFVDCKMTQMILKRWLQVTKKVMKTELLKILME